VPEGEKRDKTTKKEEILNRGGVANRALRFWSGDKNQRQKNRIPIYYEPRRRTTEKKYQGELQVHWHIKRNRTVSQSPSGEEVFTKEIPLTGRSYRARKGDSWRERMKRAPASITFLGTEKSVTGKKSASNSHRNLS